MCARPHKPKFEEASDWQCVHNFWTFRTPKICKEFQNLCKLASLIGLISGSNSSVECKFSVVTNILPDKRLSMRHETINESPNIYGNDGLWSTEERYEIINRAVEIYLKSKKQRSRSGPSAKRQKLDEAGSDSFVATEELSQTSCDKSISDESYESDSYVSDDDVSDDETDWVSQNRTECVNILIL